MALHRQHALLGAPPPPGPPGPLPQHPALANPEPVAPPPRQPTPPPPKARIPHHDIEEDVDVEQCSDSEDNNKKEGKDGKESTKDGKKKKKKRDEKPRIMKPKCNCEELLAVDCYLETKELWDKFNELGTEMIITKTGR